ncbi:hypothetical protein HDV01_005764 [Terramyces sp. JEL0728]|nr:hypothetical protein HDV01_005764 [Terramyces sp. JEL0728]
MDPKRADRVVPFKLPQIEEEEADNSQIISFVGLGLGIAGLTLKSRPAAWVSLFCAILSTLSRRTAEGDSARLGMSSLSFSVLGIVMLYINLLTQPINSSVFTPRVPGK